MAPVQPVSGSPGQPGVRPPRRRAKAAAPYVPNYGPPVDLSKDPYSPHYVNPVTGKCIDPLPDDHPSKGRGKRQRPPRPVAGARFGTAAAKAFDAANPNARIVPAAGRGGGIGRATRGRGGGGQRGGIVPSQAQGRRRQPPIIPPRRQVPSSDSSTDTVDSGSSDGLDQEPPEALLSRPILLQVEIPSKPYYDPLTYEFSRDRFLYQPKKPEDPSLIMPRDQFLLEHPKGFWLTRRPSRAELDLIEWMVVQSADTHQFFKVEILRRRIPNDRTGTQLHRLDDSNSLLTWKGKDPPEITYSRLDDDRTDVLLEPEPYFPLMYGYKFMGGGNDFLMGTEIIREVWTWNELYNGGTLADLLDKFANAEPDAHGRRRRIPEPFIWKVLDQVGHAMAYLATGLTREEIADGQRERKEDWAPIMNWEIIQETIELHFPPPAAAVKACLPRVVLAPGRRAFQWQEGDEDTSWVNMWHLGELLRRMIVLPEMPSGTHLRADITDTLGNMATYDAAVLRGFVEDEKLYSHELISELTLFEGSRQYLNQAGAQWTDPEVEQAMPSWNVFLDMIARARARVRYYRDHLLHDQVARGQTLLVDEGGREADVTWVQQDPTQWMLPVKYLTYENKSVVRKILATGELRPLDWHFFVEEPEKGYVVTDVDLVSCTVLGKNSAARGPSTATGTQGGPAGNQPLSDVISRVEDQHRTRRRRLREDSKEKTQRKIVKLFIESLPGGRRIDNALPLLRAGAEPRRRLRRGGRGG